MANAPNLMTVPHAAANAPLVTAIVSLEMDRAKVLVHPASSTTVARATTHHARPVTLMRHVHLDATTTSSNRAPTRTWAPKAA
jgi:hypothetical protein